MQPLPRWPRCLAVGAALLLIGLAGCAGGGKELSMSQGFNRWLKDGGLSASGDATQGPDAIFIPDVPASQTEGGWPRPTAWPRAATLSFVFLDGSGDTPQAPTKVRLLTSGGVLFARFDCRDDDAERLVCTSLGRDAPHLWRDDCVELIFRPEADAGVGTAHIIVNPMGAMSDSADGASGAAGASWDPPFRRRCRITKAGWAAELAMPLRAFVPIGPVPAVWRANFSRSRPGREGVFAEDTGWRATGSLRINVPDSFGWLYFQAVERKRVIPPLASFRPGGRDLLAELRDTGRLQRILRARYGRPAAVAARGEAGQLAPEARIELSALAEGTEIDLEPTAATLHQDRDAIILRVRCQESDTKSIVATVRAQAIGAEDNVSIYLAPWRKESQDYLQVTVSAAGAVQAVRTGGGPKVGGVTAKVEVLPDAWTAEVRVPLSAFKLPDGRVPALWGLNLLRHRAPRPGKAEQYSAWAPFTWSAHRPDRFGSLWLPEADAFPELGSARELERLARARSAAERPAAARLPAAVADFDWSVLSPERAAQVRAPDMTYQYLSGLRDRQYADRDRAFAQVKTWDDWLRWRKNVLTNVQQVIGLLPKQDAPLHARVSTAFEDEHVRIERLIYESRPRFYVTANVYVPKGGQGERFPAVLRVVGHSTSGRLGSSVIRQCLDLALSGYFVLSLDFPGQGERIYTNHGYGSRTPTRNHYAIGAPCVLTGGYLANYFVHDVLRGLDYLQTRQEVDMKRVVMTGSSGGGTLTSYVAAVDERIAAAAPVSALGSERRAGGNYDSEQVLYDYVRLFMDSEARCALTAPRPLTIIREVHDQETDRRNRASFERARRIYGMKRAGGRLVYVPTQYPHGYNDDHHRLFRKWLAEVMPPNHPEAPRPPTPKFSFDLLAATKSWRVYFARELPDRQTIWSVNAGQIELPLAFDQGVTAARQAQDRRRKIQQALRELICLRPPDEPVRAECLAESALAGYRAEKLILHTDPGVIVPAVLLLPRGLSDPAPAVVWIGGLGRTATIARRWSNVRTLLDAGVAVLLPDVRAVGETSPGGDPTFQGPETSLNGFSYRLGTPLIGMRVRDVLCCVRYLQARPDIRREKVGLLGDSLSQLNPPKIHHRRLLIDPGLEPLHLADSLGPTLALLAFAADEGVACCAAHGALASYASICRESHFYHPLNCFVPAILRRCDLPDVCAAAAPRPLMLAGSVNGLNQRLDAVGQDRTAFRNTRRGYKLLGAPNRLSIDPDGGAAEAADFLKRQLAEAKR